MVRAGRRVIFSAEELARGTGGALVHAGPSGPVVTDSRKVRAGDWFLALRGERFDAHDFLPQVEAAGCAGAIASRVPPSWARGFVRVEEGLRALTDLARFARSGFPGPVVGITGSAGKTTTRAMTALVASTIGKVHQTEGNLNNHVGVPLTILAAANDADVWVIEMGMNHLGEIHHLQEIARPTVRVITNVGAAHLEGVGDLEGVARAKGELFAGAVTGDVCCVNDDDERVRRIAIPAGVRVLRYGSKKDCDVRWTHARVEPRHLATTFRIEVGREVVEGSIRSPGIHLVHDACAAVAAGVALGVPVASMGPAIERYEPVGMRLRIEPGPRGTRVVNDAYNANPMSMEASLRMLASLEGVRRIAVLGDMLELGSDEEAAHAGVLATAQGLGLDGVFAAGPRFRSPAERLGIAWAPDADSLAPMVAAVLRENDILLVKGSRGMQMERVVHLLSGTTVNGAH
jgi:UDP-N-acetylmuramoyl-tripeptide--D-alanyl-D-alanine ligase